MSSRAAVVVAVLAFVATVGLRLPGLDRYVTTDESFWLGRSANFFQALAHRDWANTYQFSHPGVTVTWLGALAVLWVDPGYGFEVEEQLGHDPAYPGARPTWEVEQQLEARGVKLLAAYVAVRTALLLAFGVVVAALAVTLGRLFAWGVATLAALLIAADPFTLALSRVAHVDALASALMVLALARFLVYLARGRRTADLVVAGVVAGLACLTRVSGLVLVPVVGLIVAAPLGFCWRAGRLTRRDVADAARAMAIWGATLAATFVALWPAMWVHPLRTLAWTLTVSQNLATEPHENQVFFAGAVTSDDPGTWFYAVSLLWRTTPVVLAGLALAAARPFVPALRRRIGAVEARSLAAVLLLAIAYFALITLQAKKFDRYVLPTSLALVVVAAWGWWSAATRAGVWLRRTQRVPRAAAAAATLAVVAVAGQLAAALPAYPYYFNAYNPLLGGTPAAAEVMMVGRGEGYDRLAAQTLDLPAGEDLAILTGDPAKLAYFFPRPVAEFPTTIALPGGPPPDSTKLNDLAFAWTSADAFAVYVEQRQRRILLPGVEEALADRPLLTTVAINGLDYAWLYDIRDAPLPKVFLGPTSPAVRWGDALLLAGVDVPDDLGGEPGRSVLRSVLARPAGAAGDPTDLKLVVQVVPPDGRALSSAATLLPKELSAVPSVVDLAVDVPAGAPPGSVVRVVLRDGAGARLAARGVADGRDLGAAVVVAELIEQPAGPVFAYRPPTETVAPEVGSNDRPRRARPEGGWGREALAPPERAAKGRGPGADR